jgi:hypothetical protein
MTTAAQLLSKPQRIANIAANIVKHGYPLDAIPWADYGKGMVRRRTLQRQVLAAVWALKETRR